MKMEKLLSPENICEILGIERSTLYSWTSRGRIPFIKVNGLLRFRESELLRWLKSKERGIMITEVENILRDIQERRQNG
jgi:excisionase family DNA binding protein